MSDFEYMAGLEEQARAFAPQRSKEFGLGATFKQKDVNGVETERNAIEAVGGKRGQGNQAKMLPPLETVAAPLRNRARPLGPETAGQREEMDRERDWQRGQ